MKKATEAHRPTIHTQWNPQTRRQERVPAGTAGALEWMYCSWLGRYVTIPVD